jgi:hypothetical protein
LSPIIAKTESKIPASAHLISRWIKYDPRLHLIDPKYRINVTDSDIFNSFKVRPKVCDWLSHCTDVQLNFTKFEPNVESRKYSFKFNELKNSKYIKLLFYVEYFQPPQNIEKFDVEFDLELLHFGDPCFDLDCKNGGKCESNSTTSIPNEPICKCNENNTGELCADINYCVDVSLIF